jgi:hypothetical protein
VLLSGLKKSSCNATLAIWSPRRFNWGRPFNNFATTIFRRSSLNWVLKRRSCNQTRPVEVKVRI